MKLPENKHLHFAFALFDDGVKMKSECSTDFLLVSYYISHISTETLSRWTWRVYETHLMEENVWFSVFYFFFR